MKKQTFCIVTKLGGSTLREQRETEYLRQAGYNVVVHPLLSGRLPPKADIYHSHSHLYAMLVALSVAKVRRKKYVADYNDAISTMSNPEPIQYYEQEERWNREDTDRDLIRLKVIKDMIPAYADSILDIGCGNGVITNKLEQNVVGLDMSRTALRYLKKTTVQAKADRLPFKDKSFDLVLSAETLEHIPPMEYKIVLSEIMRVSKKYILLELPYMQNLKIGMEKCPKCGTRFHANHHYRRYTHREIGKLFGKKTNLSKWCTCGVKQPWFHPVLLFIKQRVAGRWAKSPFALCPKCGTKQNPTGFYEINSLVRWCNNKNKELAEKRHLYDSQICALYEVRN